MKIAYLVFIFSFLLTFQISNAQNKQTIDSLIKVYKELPDDTLKVGILGDLYYATKYIDVTLSKKYAFERLRLAQKINYKLGIAHGNYTMSNYYDNLDKGDSAKVYLNKALELYVNLGHKSGQFNTKHLLAVSAAREGKYDKAIKVYTECIENRKEVGDSMKLAGTYISRAKSYENKGNHQIAYSDIIEALKIYDKIDQPLWQADALYQLGVLEGIFKNYDKAIEHSIKAFNIYEQYNDKKFMGTSANGIGVYYMHLKDYENAKIFLKKSIKLCKEVQLRTFEGSAKKNLGLVYVKQKQYNLGIKYLQEALTIHREEQRELLLLETLVSLGYSHNEINKPLEALKYLNEADKLQKSKALSGNPAKIYEGKSKAFETLRNYKQSLEAYKLFKVRNDSVFNSEKSKQIEELKTIYETEKKEQQIVLQKNEIELLEQKGKISNLQKTLLGGGMLLSLGIVSFGFYGFKQKIKRNKLEKEKVDVELAFKKKELTTHALHLAKKNETLESLKQKAEELKSSDTIQNGYQQLISTINFDLQDDNNWENFSKYFQEVHKDFNSNVKQKFPEVTSNELRLMSLLKMNLSSKEIANILNISQEGIKKARYRLRKKLNITTEDSLQDLVLSL